MRTSTHDLKADRWVNYFGELASNASPRLVSVEVLSERAGEPRHVAPWRLRGIGYDPIADVLEVAVGDRGAGEGVVLRHFISAPRTITVEHAGAPWPMAILVKDASGACTRIRLVPQAPGQPRPPLPGRRPRAATTASRLPTRRPRDRGSRAARCR